jgi:transcriptional regulator with XRE-family HTH domain
MRKGMHTKIKERRVEKGFSEIECAADAGLSIHEYDDVESYEDEFIRVLSLGKARRIATKLELSLEELLGDYLGHSDRKSAVADSVPAGPRHSLVRRARLANGLSVSELADKIGYEDVAIDNLENSSDYFEVLCIDVLLDIAEVLGLDPACLIERDSQQA